MNRTVNLINLNFSKVFFTAKQIMSILLQQYLQNIIQNVLTLRVRRQAVAINNHPLGLRHTTLPSGVMYCAMECSCTDWIIAITLHTLGQFLDAIVVVCGHRER